MIVLGIDPGPVESAWCLYDTAARKPVAWAKQPNVDVCDEIIFRGAMTIIEMIACYGMPVGREVFQTCVWIGRFTESHPEGDKYVAYLERSDVKLHLCRSHRANDATIRQTILDRYGGKENAIGRKKTPGPLYGIAGDAWAALALCIVWDEQRGAKG